MPPTAFAASSETYRLEDLGMSIDIPSEYIAFTRDIADDDPNLSAYGLSKQDLSDLMESRNIYLNAWDTDVSFEIIVTMIDSEISDFNLMSDTALTTLASSFQDGYANSGITVEKYEIYQHDQAKFFKININQPNGSDIVYGLQYYTVYDHKAINVTLQSYSGKIDTDKESVIASIVSTVHFDKETLRAETRPDTEAFLYRDEDTGIEFTVPANWTQKPLSQDREAIDVKFTSNKEPGLSILYGSVDVWAEMAPSEKAGHSRSDIDNSIFTLEEFAETMGIEKSIVSTVSYGDKEYYAYVNTTSSSKYGVDLDITQTCLMRFENGYAYTFQFAGGSTSPYYEDFESLLESVKYPAIENTLPSKREEVSESTPPSNYGGQANRTVSSDSVLKNTIAELFISLLITIAIYSVPILIYRYAIIKMPVQKKRAKKITIVYGVIAFIVMSCLLFAVNGSGAAGASIIFWSWVNYRALTGGKTAQPGEPIVKMPAVSSEAIPVAKSMSADDLAQSPESSQEETEVPRVPAEAPPRKIMYCRRCGAKLVEGSKFCSNCGTLIEKGDIQ